MKKQQRSRVGVSVGVAAISLAVSALGFAGGLFAWPDDLHSTTADWAIHHGGTYGIVVGLFIALIVLQLVQLMALDKFNAEDRERRP